MWGNVLGNCILMLNFCGGASLCSIMWGCCVARVEPFSTLG